MIRNLPQQTFLLISTFIYAALPTSAQDEAEALNLADQLEEAIFQQEANLDLPSAIKLYQEILATEQAINSLAAESHYRLAICYLDQGNKNLAIQELAILVEKYPEQSKWVEASQKHLPREFTPTITPWKDGERVVYEWRLPNGKLMAKSVSTLYLFEYEGRKLWRKESRTHRISGSLDMATVVEFDPVTFESVYSEYISAPMGDNRCWYNEKGATLKYAGKEDETVIPFSQKPYDNEQAAELMRQFPIEVGYSTVKNLFISFAGMNMPIRFEITDILDVEVPYGTFECYKVSIEVMGMSQSIFISTDDSRLIVKMKAGEVEASLTRVEDFQANTTQEYRNDKYGFSFDHKASWAVVDRTKKDNQITLAMLNPTANGSYLLFSNSNDIRSQEENENMEIWVEDQINLSRKYKAHLGFKLNEHTKKKFQINGMDAISYRSEFTTRDDIKVNFYMAFVKSSTRDYKFLGHTPENGTVEAEAQFEKIISTLKEF